MELRPLPPIKNYINFQMLLNMPFNFSAFIMSSCLVLYVISRRVYSIYLQSKYTVQHK